MIQFIKKNGTNKYNSKIYPYIYPSSLLIIEKIETLPPLDLSSTTSLEGTFDNCRKLLVVPQLSSTENITNLSYTFRNCRELKEIPLLDTKNVIYLYETFLSCNSLITVPKLDTSSVTNFRNTFSGCYSLSSDSLNNILAMCKDAISYTGTKTLNWLGLSSGQATTCQGLSNYADFVAAGWSTGY